jgi:hypothetical protein
MEWSESDLTLLSLEQMLKRFLGRFPELDIDFTVLIKMTRRMVFFQMDLGITLLINI